MIKKEFDDTNSLVVLVAGTRPEFVKLVPVMRALDERGLGFRFVWSGQHYDYELSRVFFEEFGGVVPDVDLRVGGGSQGGQVAGVLVGLERVLGGAGGGGVVVGVGDTNTVLGAALAAVKGGWVFAHVEAGLRSFDRFMPEEVNRVVADSVGNVLFAPSVGALLNLLYEGVEAWRVFLSGNTVVDAVGMVLPRVVEVGERVLGRLEVGGRYVLVTVHRAENVDFRDRLEGILRGLQNIAREGVEVVFPMHPRTRARVEEFRLGGLLEGVRVVRPLGYLEFLALLRGAWVVLTDSGGVQEEAFTLGVPCITLRLNTERPETVWLGGNFLAGTRAGDIVAVFRRVSEEREAIAARIRGVENPYGDGKAGERIAGVLERLVEDPEYYNRFAYTRGGEPDYRRSGYPLHVLVDAGEAGLAGETVAGVEERAPGVRVTLLYDPQGNPHPPYPDARVKQGWKIRLWGPQKHLENLLNRHIRKPL